MRLNIKLPFVAILRGIRPDEVIKHSVTLVDEGFEIIEVPTNSPKWHDSVKILQSYWQDKILIGAGTVITSTHVELLVNSHAKLMVSPNMDIQLIAQAKAHGLTTCIGAFSPSEVIAAQQAGVDIIKIFPASVLGSAYIKAMRSVLAKEQLVYAVGGITSNNLNEYYNAGCQGFGLGSDLYKAEQTVDQTRHKARAFIQAWENIAK